MLENENHCRHTMAGGWRLGSTGLVVSSITSALRTSSISDIRILHPFFPGAEPV